MKKLLIVFMIIASGFTSVLMGLSFTSTNAYAACDDGPILGITRWYRGLLDANCTVKAPGNGDNDLAAFITKVALNVVQAALTIAAYVAIFFIIKGGFRYMLSAGSSDGMASAKKTIVQAVIGLAIVLLSAIIVNTIASIL